MQNFRSKAATAIELRFFMKKQKQKKMKMIMFICISYLVIFSSHFLHAVIFLPVLHLDVLRRQIETETEISLCMAIMLDHPWQSLYTQYYRTV